MTAFEVSISIKKEFLKKNVNGAIAFALISLLNVLIQKPASRSITTIAFVFAAKFIIIKYFKQEVDENLSIYVGEFSTVAFL